MATQAASATYSLITYSNAYSTVLGPRERMADEHRTVRFMDVLRDAAERVLRAMATRRQAAQRNASLRRASREAAAAEREARAIASRYPSMAQELRAISAHRMGQFD